jgi:hypothetical protein
MKRRLSSVNANPKAGPIFQKILNPEVAYEAMIIRKASNAVPSSTAWTRREPPRYFA